MRARVKAIPYLLWAKRRMWQCRSRLAEYWTTHEPDRLGAAAMNDWQ
jgi:hypothetical protein